MTLRVGSCFSGVGGLCGGFQDEGFQIAWQIEIDDAARGVLDHLYPGVPKFRDIRDVHGARYLDAQVRTWFKPLGADYTPEELDVAGKLKKLTPAQAMECVRLYDSGLSLSPIATYFGVSRQAMWDLVRRRTKMRPQKRCGAANHFYRGGETADDQAHNIVESAIEQGVLVRREACEVCNSSGTTAVKVVNGVVKLQADAPRYRQIGNGVVRPVARYVANRLKRVIESPELFEDPKS